MVNYFENDQAIPIILGNCKEVTDAARIIRRNTNLEVTVLAKRLSFINRIRFRHRVLTSSKENIVLLTLKDIADQTSEYATPLLIYCDKHNGELISRHISELEERYVIILAQEINNYFKGNG